MQDQANPIPTTSEDPTMTTERLDEQALRRKPTTPGPGYDAGFAGGTPVTMSDGQEWIISSPNRLWMLSENEDGFDVIWKPEGYAATVKDWHAAAEARDNISVIRAEMKLFRMLICRNYDLTTSDLGSILQLSYGDSPTPENEAMRTKLLSIALGIPTDSIVLDKDAGENAGVAEATQAA